MRARRVRAAARDLVVLQVAGSAEALAALATLEGARTGVQTHVHLETAFGRETRVAHVTAERLHRCDKNNNTLQHYHSQNTQHHVSGSVTSLLTDVVMHAHVRVERRLDSELPVADLADERLLTGVRAHVTREITETRDLHVTCGC